MFTRASTAFRSSRSNKELIAPLLKPSAITGDYGVRTWCGTGGGEPRNFALLIIDARDTCFMARKLRAAVPHAAKRRGAVGVRELRGSPN